MICECCQAIIQPGASHECPSVWREEFPNPFLDGNEGAYLASAAPALAPRPGVCEKCGRTRTTLINRGTDDSPSYWCGTCIHRDARRTNTREMYGRGRRGY